MKKYLIVSLSILSLSMAVYMDNTYADSKKAEKPPDSLYMKQTEDESASQDASPISGKIVEAMNSGGYTYLCIEKDGKKTWAAILETNVAVGQEVALQPGYEMVNFTSKTLNRTFDKIIFSTGFASQEGATDTKSYHGKPMGSKSQSVVSNEPIKVEKVSGPNAFTVAELYEKRTELDKKNIVVRGKVVKVSSGIMGRNWLHIQDGTGNSESGTHDLVVTTHDITSVGDIVTANGTLYKDKDFGSGYKYDVIVEQASIKKENAAK